MSGANRREDFRWLRADFDFRKWLTMVGETARRYAEVLDLIGGLLTTPQPVQEANIFNAFANL